jgi:hypothetical protein
VAFCDPAPSTTDGVTTYENTCTTEVTVRCGVCGLGAYTCGDDGSYACSEPALPGAGDLRPNCDSADRPTFVYLDPTYQGVDSDGTREKPFATLDAAFDRIRSVDAKALVIGGSPELTVPKEESGRAEAPYYGFRVPEGISILGGYSTSPDFAPEASQRPTIYAPDANIALEAADIDTPTVLTGLTFENSRDSISDTSYGAVIRQSAGLELVDVTIVANEAAGLDEWAVIADPMGPSTYSYVPQQQSFQKSQFIQDDFCASIFTSDLNVEPDPFDPPACEIWDDRARAAYGAPTGPDIPDDNVLAIGGAGSSPTWNNTDTRSPGGNGITPLPSVSTTNAGGYWEDLDPRADEYDWRQRPPEDAVAYEGADRFAQSGSAGQTDGELDSEGMWAERSSGKYGAIGYSGGSGGGGAGGESLLAVGVIDSSGDIKRQCFADFPGEYGGGGGCGGLGGRAGKGGRWAIGVLLDESPNTTFENVRLDVADAGHGQSGSAGGEGANGAPGNPSRSYTHTYTYRQPFGGDVETTITMESQAGGDGAKGQWGGHGGHGAGGSVVGVVCANTRFEDLSGFDFQLGEPGAGATGRDPNAPADMPAPADAPDGEKLEAYQCDPPPAE